MREAFDADEYQILLVANKFQAGFDQPLLSGMYVDKRLGGIQAVQTLSRLNRSYTGPFGVKDTTYVLDFVNEAAEILLAFKTYYTTAQLENVTDPNIVYNLRAKLDAAGVLETCSRKWSAMTVPFIRKTTQRNSSWPGETALHLKAD
jgi:type I restriction enzyme, R subunit